MGFSIKLRSRSCSVPQAVLLPAKTHTSRPTKSLYQEITVARHFMLTTSIDLKNNELTFLLKSQYPFVPAHPSGNTSQSWVCVPLIPVASFPLTTPCTPPNLRKLHLLQTRSKSGLSTNISQGITMAQGTDMAIHKTCL